MSSKTLTGTYLGYYIKPGVTNVTVAAGGEVFSRYGTTNALSATESGAYAVVNYGLVEGSAGYAGVSLAGGGSVTNGSDTDTNTTVEGGYGVVLRAAGAVVNFGTIAGLGTQFGVAVYLDGGGSVTNGAANDTTAVIEGEYGIKVRHANSNVENFGTIRQAAQGYNGVVQQPLIGDTLKNGTVIDTAALIEGDRIAVASYGSVTNLGTIETIYGGSAAVYGGGTLTNGARGDITALVNGYYNGASVRGATNYGSIIGHTGDGVILFAGGDVDNGAGLSRSALIEGSVGIYAPGGGVIFNLGTVSGTQGAGIDLGGGRLINGLANASAARVDGYVGVTASGGATVSNYGSIEGLGLIDADGVELTGASLTNGSSTDRRALISGYVGVDLSGGATLDNFGTVSGSSGLAVYLHTAADTVVAEAGCVFDGAVDGYNLATLDLGSGVGTVAAANLSAIVVSGSMATTTFSSFGALEIGAGAQFTLAGRMTIGAGQGLIVEGRLNAASTITSAGGVTVSGTVVGIGTLSLTGGTATFDTGADLSIAKVAESGTAVATFAGTTITVANVWTQAAGSVTAATGDRVNFTGTGNVFSGTLSGAGTIGCAGGTDALSGTTLSAKSVVIDGAAVTLSGSLDVTDTVAVTSTDLTIAAAGASLTGGGAISLSNAATNVIKGASAGALLTLVSGRIVGAGQLGDGEMALTNDAGGTIDAYLGAALTINLGTNTLANAGLIENAGTGGLTISGATDNTGTLEAIKGTLTVDGAVSGAGTVKIAGGTAAFASTFTQNVAFTSAGGVLKLSNATTYTGTITGFAKTSITSLDLTDIAFTGASVSYSGTATSGVLTVKSGANTAKIKLTGDYLTSTFTLSKDAGGGTIVTDPPEAATKPPITTLPLVTAMAGFGGAGDLSQELPATAPPARLSALAMPAAA